METIQEIIDTIKQGTDIHIYTGKAGVGKSPNQSFLFI